MQKKPFNELEYVQELAKANAVKVRENAYETALEDFSWEHKDIVEAFCRLRPHHFYKSEVHTDKPHCMVDYYKAKRLYERQDVYTHIYVEDETLIISSFKQLADEKYTGNSGNRSK